MEREILAVEHAVGKMVYPVAEYYHAAVSDPQWEIYQYVAVSEYEIVNRAGMLLEVAAAKFYQRLVFLTFETRCVMREISRMARPPVGERNGPPGMYRRVEPLTEPVAERGAYRPEQWGQLSEAVAVAEKESASHYGAHLISVDDAHAYLVAEVIEEPDIVVADVPCYFHACV